MPPPAAPPLYQRWTDLAARRGDDVGLTLAGSGVSFSFGALAELAEAAPVLDSPLVSTTSGLELLIDVLRCWRDQQPLLAIEAGSVPTGLADLRGLPSEIAHIKLTSGSGGSPRLVLFEEGQIAVDAEQIVNTMGLAEHGSNIGVISLAHSYGFSNLMLPLLLHGVPLVLGESPLPAALDTALDAAGKGAILPAVPAMWKAWMKAGVLDGGRISLAISAGAPLTASLERQIFDRCALKVHNFYGASECGGIAFDASREPRLDSRLVGTPMSGVDLSVGDEGALSVSSPAVGCCYWPPDAGDELGDGVFRTSDIVESNSETGGVYLCGRRGESINVAGRKVSPAEIEEAIMAVAGIEHCVVFGIPSEDPQRVEEMVASINGKVDEAEIRRALVGSLSPWQIPRHWWRPEGLAPNQRGKISRSEWRRRYLDL